MAKNALLTLADLWRSLGGALDPELPMVCPVLIKKLADKVEFLAEAAREVITFFLPSLREAVTFLTWGQNGWHSQCGITFCSDNTLFMSLLFFIILFYFPAQLVGGSLLSDLLDMP